MLLLFAPLLVPLATAALCLLLRRSPRTQQALSLLGGGALLLGAVALLAKVAREGIQTAQTGSWPAPFGITLVADLCSALLVALAGLVGLLVLVYSCAGVDEARRSFGFHPLVHALLAGVCGAFLTGDLFNLFVWFEVMLISSFALLALGGERAQLEGALKYVVLNLMASALFVAAVGLLYGVAGTLNLAHLSVRLAESSSPRLVAAIGVLLLVAFGIKAAIFPLFFWLPEAYPPPPAAVTALFAGLLTKVGVYALLRVFTLLFVQPELHRLILVIAALTMVTGVLGAAAQREIRRILAFHSISQIGYMLVGLGLLSPLGVASSIFFMLHHGIVKSCLFLVSGLVERSQGTSELDELGGLYRTQPQVAALFLVPALSLAGTPPLQGFFAKLLVVDTSLRADAPVMAATALAVGLLTLYSMTKIWLEAFWKPPPPRSPGPARGGRLPGAMLAPVVTLVAVTSLLGLLPGGLYELVVEAGRQLLEPSGYIRAVLKEGG